MILIMALGLTVHCCRSQSFNKAGLDAYFHTLDSAHLFMGSVAVTRDGKPVYQHSVGFKDVDRKLTADLHSKYRIGSITKTFTTVLVMKAVEEKRISLDQTIEKYFPTVPNADKITISDLLYHRSGVHNFTADSDYQKWMTEPQTEAQMVAIIARGGSDFEPGTKASYSNSNFVLLSYILERLYKKPYARLLKERITGPLGLKDTYFGGPIRVERNECLSYQFLGTWRKAPETDMSIPMGAGSIVSTPSDLVKFMNALFSGKLVRPESLEKMETLKDRFGMGLFPIPFYEKKGFGHNGGIDGFTSVLIYFPDDTVAYALTSNGTNFNNNDISIAVLSAVYGKPIKMPAVKRVNKDLDDFIGEYKSAEFPLKISITHQGGVLIGQATGQSAFPLEEKDTNVFAYPAADLELIFSPSGNKMILKQHGRQFTFTR